MCFYVHTSFCELNSAFNGISHKKLFAVFLPSRREFLSDNLVTYSGQNSQQIADKKVQITSELKRLAGTKVYYCFNSKGDNFKVNQLCDAAKNKLYVRDKMSCSFFIGDRWPLKSVFKS